MPAQYDADAPHLAPQDPGLLTAIRRHPKWAIGPVVVAAVLGVLATWLLPTMYTTRAQVVLGNPNDVTVFREVPILNATARAQNAAQVMRSQAVYDRASEILRGRLSPQEIMNSVSITPGEEGNPLVTVRATAKAAELARETANAEGRAYLDVVQSQAKDRQTRTAAALTKPKAEMQDRLAKINKTLADRVAAAQTSAAGIGSPADRARSIQAVLDGDQEYQDSQNMAGDLVANIGAIDKQLREARIDASLTSAGVDTLYEAATPNEPTSPNLTRNLGIAIVLGLLLGAALAWRRLDRDRAVQPTLAEVTLGAPQIGSLRRDRELSAPAHVVDLTPGRDLADDLSGLAASLILSVRRRNLAGFVVTSARQGEGKTTIALNLAAAARATGHDVVLVDADVRNPELTNRFGLDDSPGLLEFFAGDRSGANGVRHTLGPDWDLAIIPIDKSSRATATELRHLRGDQFAAPVMVIDSPASTEAPVAMELAARSTGLVVVVANTTTVDELRTLRARADLAGAPILGFLINDHRPARRRQEANAGGQRRRAKQRAPTVAAESAVVHSE